MRGCCESRESCEWMLSGPDLLSQSVPDFFQHLAAQASERARGSSKQLQSQTHSATVTGRSNSSLTHAFVLVASGGLQSTSPANNAPRVTLNMISILLLVVTSILGAACAFTYPHPPAMSATKPAAETAPNLEQIKQQISRAISVGAPAYNAGDIKGCANTYAAAAQTILGNLPDQLRINLDKCLEDMNGDEGDMNDDARAWALRRQFDAILAYTSPFLPVPLKDSGNVVLEPFTSQQLPSQPVEVMDIVMGGISSGTWTPSVTSPSLPVGNFCGSTSLANNGGFASLRWRFPTLQNWSYAKGMYLKVQHSNPGEHTFRLILKDGTCERIRLANFKVVFSNPSSLTESAADSSDHAILIPFSEMSMEQMGNAMLGAPSFNPSAVTEIGIMAIKPTVVGKFKIEILDWGLYI